MHRRNLTRARPSQASGPHHEIARQRLELRQIFAAPFDHFAHALLPADLRFPTDIALDGGAIEPIPRILMLAVDGHPAKPLAPHFDTLGHTVDRPANPSRLPAVRD